MPTSSHGASFDRNGARADDPSCDGLDELVIEVIDGRVIHDPNRADSIRRVPGRRCEPLGWH